MSTYEAFILGDVLMLTSNRDKAGIGGLIEMKGRKIQIDRCKLRIFDRIGNLVIPGVQLSYDSCVTMHVYNDKWF
jgi:hypothetical protein